MISTPICLVLHIIPERRVHIELTVHPKLLLHHFAKYMLLDCFAYHNHIWLNHIMFLSITWIGNGANFSPAFSEDSAFNLNNLALQLFLHII